MKTLSCGILALLLGYGAALHAADIIGTWEGTLDMGEDSGAVAFVFSRAGDQLSGNVKTARWGEFPMLELKAEGDSVTFRVQADAGAYVQRGTVKDDAMDVKTLTPEGKEVSFVLHRKAAIAGRWLAKAEGPDGNAMELVFTFRLADGKLTGTVTGPWGEVPFSEAAITGNELTFSTQFEGLTITHRGTVAGDTISLDVRSSEWEFPLKLLREKVATP